MKKIYVASRFSGDIEANVSAARKYCRIVIDRGYMPMASHLLYPQVLCDDIREERETGMSFGFEMIRMCDEVWVFGPVSAGMGREIEKAREFNKPVVYMDVTGEAVTEKGEWLERQVFTIEESTISEWQSAKCSKCGKYHTTPYMYYFHEYAFCPHCGKPMEVKR